MYEKLQAIATKTGLRYWWLRQLAIDGTIPTLRTSPKGVWMAKVDKVMQAVRKLEGQPKARKKK